MAAVYVTFAEQRIYELSQYNGVLYPANDPDPPLYCEGIPASALKLVFGEGKGDFTIIAEGKHAWVIVAHHNDPPEDKVLLGIERQPDGTVSLTARIMGEDGKSIANIDNNTFEINRNKILDSLSPPRTDLSTIILRDEYGNKLKIRFMNKRSISFLGKLYYRPGEYVEADDKGFRVMPNNSSWKGRTCFILSNPEGAGFLQVGDE